MLAGVTSGTNLGRVRTVLTLSALALLTTRPAGASPSFDLSISTGGVQELAVGQTLALHAYHPSYACLPPPYTGKRKEPMPPISSSIVWSVEPRSLATISKDGLLTASGAGVITVKAAVRDPGGIAPGQRWLVLHKELPSFRLPRLDSGPAIEAFDLRWDGTPYQSRHELGLAITGAGFAWSAGLQTPTLPDGPFPWVLVPEKNHRGFNDEEGYDEGSQARQRAFVTDARLTISSWKDEIITGRLELKTTRGIDYDATFQARLADRDGVLAKAAALPAKLAAPSASPDPAMK